MYVIWLSIDRYIVIIWKLTFYKNDIQSYAQIISVMHYEFLQTDEGTKIKENAIKFLHFLLDNKIYIREMNIETLDFIPCHGPFFSFVCIAAISLIGCEQNCK